jgi:probable F420-dependent oxidoreductase
LRLSAERSAGAHPYLTTPDHTAQARTLMGAQAFLAPEHKVLLTTDMTHAREVGRQTLDMYLGLQNYVNNWKRLGFNDHDLTRPISDRLIDAMIAYGTTDAIAARLNEHLDAGADHVPIRVLASPDELIPAVTALAAALGLSRSRVEEQ